MIGPAAGPGAGSLLVPASGDDGSPGFVGGGGGGGADVEESDDDGDGGGESSPHPATSTATIRPINNNDTSFFIRKHFSFVVFNSFAFSVIIALTTLFCQL